MDRRIFLASGFASVFLTQQTYADGAHVAFTVIEHNARTGSLEVIHRLMALDLEIALTARLAKRVRLDAILNESGEAQVEAYLADNFAIADQNGEPIELAWVGMTLDRDSLVAYLEAPMPEGLDGLVITNQILTEAHPTQVNTVNVTINGRTRTRTFAVGDPAQSVTFS